ncbi:M15 family metallopeptidase [Salinimicrobium sp. HB62]|uniref:M15 family metallopeptidase n=1 Tax=Salinimicrobium sp. HB62 TaxID=3077781 RepID=UPI002D7A3948|nr:M15 family metallopeptidase [Salinimicrobium sp. HB62]
MILRLFAFIFFISIPAFSQETAVEKKFLLGKFDYKQSGDFVKVDPEYADKTIYLNSVVYTAFKEMHRAASKDGIDLKILSGTRSFEEQKKIWEYKWRKLVSLSPLERAKSILVYSAMPSTSRHHWGTDIDLNYLENCHFEEGKGKAVYEWLVKNAAEFGFHQVYTSQEFGRKGYHEEKWHWSYLPIASKFLSLYNAVISSREITGFAGSELAEEIKIIQEYVNGIPTHLLEPLPTAIFTKAIVQLQEAE